MYDISIQNKVNINLLILSKILVNLNKLGLINSDIYMIKVNHNDDNDNLLDVRVWKEKERNLYFYDIAKNKLSLKYNCKPTRP